jgi:uncharacterized iron-regulated membrane protein
MNKKLLIRKIHRWLAIIIGIQLLFWTVSGAYFSLVHIATVRGEDRMHPQQRLPLSADLAVVSPLTALQVWRQTQPGDNTPIDRISLRLNGSGQPEYTLFSASANGGKWPLARVDARTGTPLPPLSREAAEHHALADYAAPAKVTASQLIHSKPPSEYKGPLPVWQVKLDDARHTHLYISPVDGQVLARRNSWWRTFDFLWMLHILDFDSRDNFNNLLLRSIAPAAVIVVLSGYLLWWISRRRRI